MARTPLSRVQDNGQVTIPSEVRKKLGLKKGDLVAFVETEQGIMIAPQETVAADALERIGEILRENELTLEEIMASGREIRGLIAEANYGPGNTGP